MTQVTLEIKHDQYCENPREAFDNITQLVMKDHYGDDDAFKMLVNHLQDRMGELQPHKRKHWLSDIAGVNTDNPPNWWMGDYRLDLAEEELDWEKVLFILQNYSAKQLELFWLPIYMYQHSGVAISHSAFSCPWDSGQAGVHVVYFSKVKEEAGLKTKLGHPAWLRDGLKWAEHMMKCELETYGQYVSGEVYCYTLESEDGSYADSCWGFYGDHENSGILEHIPKEFHPHISYGELTLTLEL